VRLTFSPGKVVVEAQTDGRARAVETVPADFHGEEPVIAFNPHYLLDGLAAAAATGPAGADPGHPAPEAAPGVREPVPPADPGLIRIEFTSPAKPALITRVPPAPAPDDEGAAGGPGTAHPQPGFRYLVVPLRSVARP
jgi:DNA polymerase III sliding clamp (beta) subunit (PCNA family)